MLGFGMLDSIERASRGHCVVPSDVFSPPTDVNKSPLPLD